MEQPREEPDSGHVLASPTWLFALRIAQAVLALLVLALAGAVAHDVYLDELGLALAISIFTWIVVTYTLVTEKVPRCRPAYHVIAVLVLDAVFIVLWLATFAAVAARRARFTVNVSVNGCFDNGDSLNSKHCFIKRAILFQSGRDMMSAAAGLGALIWISYIVTFVWTLLAFLRGRKEGRFQFNTNTATANGNYQMEPKVEQQQPIQQPQHATDPYQQSPLPQSHPQPAQSPYEQQPPYSPPSHGTYSPPSHGTYSPPPHGTYSPPPHGTYSPPPHDQHAYAQHAPQQYPQEYQQTQGGKLSTQEHYAAPSPAAGSPPPLQPYHHQQ